MSRTQLRGVLLVGRAALRSYIQEQLRRRSFLIEGNNAVVHIDVPDNPAGTPSGYDVYLTGWETPLLSEEIVTERAARPAQGDTDTDTNINTNTDSEGVPSTAFPGYICHVTGTMKNIVPRAFVSSPDWIVSNWGTAISSFVSEMTLTLLLSCARRLPEANLLLTDASRAGEAGWKQNDFYPTGTSLYRKRVGLYGYGRIGREFAHLLNPFGVQVSVYDPYCDLDDESVVSHQCESLSELFADNDVVSIHCALTPQTRGSVGTRLLQLMPDDGIVINTARAAVIDETALREAVLHSSLRFGLDVFHREPPDPEDPIVTSPRVVATPHSANEVGEDQYAAMWNVVEQNLIRYLSGLRPHFPVDETTYDRMT